MSRSAKGRSHQIARWLAREATRQRKKGAFASNPNAVWSKRFARNGVEKPCEPYSLIARMNWPDEGDEG